MVVVVWADDEVPHFSGDEYIRAAEGTAAGFGAVRTLEKADLVDDEPAAGVDASGVVTAAWAPDEDGAHVVRRDVDATWSAIEVVGPGTRSNDVALAVAANGDAGLLLDRLAAARSGPRASFRRSRDAAALARRGGGDGAGRADGRLVAHLR